MDGTVNSRGNQVVRIVDDMSDMATMMTHSPDGEVGFYRARTSNAEVGRVYS